MDKPVLRSADLPAGTLRRVDGILVTRLSTGRVVALAATCPHQSTELADGTVTPEGRIRCALHHYEYDLDTGENVVPTRDADPATLVKLAPGYLELFGVEERDGWIFVSPEAVPPPASYVGRPTRPEPSPIPGRTAVRAGVGTTFELRLRTNVRPGHVWRVETTGECVAVVGQRVERGDHVVRLAARTPGRAAVRCLYARPWDREPAEIRTYDVEVYS